MEKHINLPILKEQLKDITSGDYVYLTGTLYTARDAAHGRMAEQMAAALDVSVYELLSMDNIDLKTAKKLISALPVDIENQTIYYLGPTPAKDGQVIGSAGPTTSSRMDKYTPLLIRLGLSAMIGKGKRSDDVINAMKSHGAVYFAAVGGAGALLSKCIKKSEVVAYDDLGTEAIRRLHVEELPVIAVIDTNGNNQYETAVSKWSKITK